MLLLQLLPLIALANGFALPGPGSSSASHASSPGSPGSPGSASSSEESSGSGSSSSGAGSASNCFSGATTITEDDIGDLSDECTTIPGITISGASINTINLKNVVAISGPVSIKSSSLTTFNAPSLEYVGGEFDLESDSLSTLDLSALQGTGGGLAFSFGKSSLTTLSLPALTSGGSSISGGANYSFSLTNSPNLQSVSSLFSFTEEQTLFLIAGCGALKTLKITGGSGGAKSAGPGWAQVSITETSLESLPDALWAGSTGHVKLYSNPNLGDISVPIQTIGDGASLDVSGTGKGDVDFPSLESVAGDINILATQGTTIDLSSLTSVSGSITASQNEGIRRFEADKLNKVDSFSFNSNNQLGGISFAALETFTDLRIYDNQVWNEIDLAAYFPKLSDVTGVIAIRGPITKITVPPKSSGTGVRAQQFIVNSTVEFDCDAFKSDVSSQAAVADESNVSCTSGPKGSKPTVTAAPLSSSGGGKSNGGAIAGGVIGALLALGLAAGGGFFYWKKKQKVKSNPEGDNVNDFIAGGAAAKKAEEGKGNMIAEVDGTSAAPTDVKGAAPPYSPPHSPPPVGASQLGGGGIGQISELSGGGGYGQTSFAAELPASPVTDARGVNELPAPAAQQPAS